MYKSLDAVNLRALQQDVGAQDVILGKVERITKRVIWPSVPIALYLYLPT